MMSHQEHLDCDTCSSGFPPGKSQNTWYSAPLWKISGISMRAPDDMILTYFHSIDQSCLRSIGSTEANQLPSRHDPTASMFTPTSPRLDVLQLLLGKFLGFGALQGSNGATNSSCCQGTQPTSLGTRPRPLKGSRSCPSFWWTNLEQRNGGERNPALERWDGTGDWESQQK